MSHEWKFGDWGIIDVREEICRYIGPNGDIVGWFLHGDMTIVSRLYGSVTYLPDCDSFDWKPPKPIEPPPGYRLVTGDELRGDVFEGDRYLSSDGRWYVTTTAGESVVAMLRNHYVKAYARKIEPQYRPFASAAEYEPFFDKVIARSEMGVITPGGWRPIGYSDEGIYPDVSVMDYAYAFKLLKFKDGTPFGIQVDSK